MLLMVVIVHTLGFVSAEDNLLEIRVQFSLLMNLCTVFLLQKQIMFELDTFEKLCSILMFRRELFNDNVVCLILVATLIDRQLRERLAWLSFKQVIFLHDVIDLIESNEVRLPDALLNLIDCFIDEVQVSHRIRRQDVAYLSQDGDSLLHLLCHEHWFGSQNSGFHPVSCGQGSYVVSGFDHLSTN